MRLFGNTKKNPFKDLPRTPAEHFKLYFYAAVSHVIQQLVLSVESVDDTFAKFSFLLGYLEEIAGREPDGLSAPDTSEWWRTTLNEWEESAHVHLPLRALRQTCDLNHEAMTLFMCAGLLKTIRDLDRCLRKSRGHRDNGGLTSV